MSSVHPSRNVLANMLRSKLESDPNMTPADLIGIIERSFDFILRDEQATLNALLITAPVAQIGIKIVENFEMTVSARYDYKGYIWFSNGTYEISPRFMNEESLQVMKDIIIPEWEAKHIDEKVLNNFYQI